MKQHRSHAYTLVEVLVVVTILGIAGALVVPAIGGTGVLRVQSAVRTIVADITAAQSDALAYQRGRAILFFPSENRYRVLEVKSETLDPDLDMLWETNLSVGQQFGDSAIEGVELGDADTLIFDEMGGPVTTPDGNEPAPTQTITVTGSDQKFVITIEAYTGRVTVRRTTD